MNDKIFLVCLFYLFMGSTLIGLMPDEFVSGVSTPTTIKATDIDGNINSSYGVVTKGSTFLGKFLSFMFIPISISGIPTLIGLILQVINLFCIFFSVIYVYKLIRGIST